MKILFTRIALFIFLVSCFGSFATAQNPSSGNDFFSNDEPDRVYDQWDIYTSHVETVQIEHISGNEFVILTTGGFYFYSVNGQVTRYSRTDGKYDIQATSMVLDRSNNRVWFGYADGTLSMFNLETFQFRHFDDIRRNDRFVSNRVNDVVLHAGILYVATDFGLVKFNPQQFFVIDTYTRFGRIASASPVKSVFVNDGKITLGTDFGLATGMMSDDLKVPDNWDVFDASNGFVSQTVDVAAHSENRLYASVSGQGYYFDGTSWQTNTQLNGITSRFRPISTTEWHLTTSSHFLKFNPQANTMISTVTPAGGVHLMDAVSTGGHIVFGTKMNGIGLVQGNPVGSVSPEYFVPAGPLLNLFENLTVTSRGELIVGTSSTPGQFDIGIYDTGFSIVDREGNWSNYYRSTSSFLNQTGLNSFFNVASVKDQYFIGSWGGGIVQFDRATGEFRHYNYENSGLAGISLDPNYYVATGLAADRNNENYVWAVSWSNTTNPLGRMDLRTKEWELFPFVSLAGAGSLYRDVFVDTHGQKWIPLLTNTTVGRGLLVLRNPAGGSGEAIRLTSNQDLGALPNEKINAIIQDRRGEVWVGTDRGIGRFLFPDRVINGTTLERRSQPLINEDTTAFDRVLLRDVRVTSMVVDANNQKWIGSEGDGIYLIEESGRRVIRHFTMNNSPLPSNTIKSLAIDTERGVLYISTSNALVRYSTLEREAVGNMSSLRIFPNPYSYARHDGEWITIEDLADDATVHVLTVDGRLVRRFQSRGGRIAWDALDDAGKKVSTGVYFIVATGNTNDQVARGRVVIVR